MKDKNKEANGVKKLWAPWRMQYIDGIDNQKNNDCIFCDKPRENDDDKNFIIYRGVPYFHGAASFEARG